MPSLTDNPAFLAACEPKKLTKIIATQKTKRKARPEAKIQEHIIAYLRGQGWFPVRINSSVLPGAANHARVPSYVAHSKYGKHMAGHPDVVAYRGKQALFFEVKTDTGKLSERQERFLEVLREIGASAHVVRSVDDVQKILQEVSFE